ncbi:MAG: 50S ribosomal protein L15 [Chitinispirillaceae bacterium]|nr:50S ribosomal protein L15 [Chitinispirillaceae bacterium]
MLTLNGIRPAAGSNKQSRRVGRGTGSGKGCTAGNGMNGHLARSGTGRKPYFEGGQTPLTRRLPKKGFSSPSMTGYQIVNVQDLASFDPGVREITAASLFEKGLIKDADRPVKVLGRGELSRPLTVSAHAFSKAAKEKIEKAKGKAEAKGRG